MTDRTIPSLCQRSHEISRSKGWYNGEEHDTRPIKLITLLAQSELIEALEEWRKHKKFDEIYFSYEGQNGTIEMSMQTFLESPSEMKVAQCKPEGILVELADCVIRIAQRCGSDGRNLESIMAAHGATNTAPDFEEVLACAMGDLSMSYLVTTPFGMSMAEKSGLPTDPAWFWGSVVHALFQLSASEGADLWKAIELKEAFNKTRPHKHGNKKA
jgi:hypothetical protein